MKTQSSWREFIQSLTSDFTFHSPAILNEVEKVESSLSVLFPDELKSLLQETDGVEGPYGLGVIWNVERIKKDNLNFRQFPDFKNLYMPFDHLLFFADARNGDAHPPEWRANEMYKIIRENEFIETLELAPLNKAFEVYTTVTLQRSI